VRSAVVLNARRLAMAAAAASAASGAGALTFELLEGFSQSASKRNLALVASPRGIA
jgi:hypothetical protein